MSKFKDILTFLYVFMTFTKKTRKNGPNINMFQRNQRNICFSVFWNLSWKDFLYVITQQVNFYPNDTIFGTQVGLVKIQVKFEDGLCGSHSGPREHHKKIEI